MPRKKQPRRSVEALHRAIQHHIIIERELAEVHRELVKERDDVNSVDAIRARSEHLALSARLLELLGRLDPRHPRTREWRAAQMRRLEERD